MDAADETTAPRTRAPAVRTEAPVSPSEADPVALSEEVAGEQSVDAPNRAPDPAPIAPISPAAIGGDGAPPHDRGPVVVQPTHDAAAQPQTELLTALPHPREGACAFEPLPNRPALVENAHCPDGVFRGDIRFDSDAEVEQLRGCTRIVGHVDVIPEHVTSLGALESLRVIEGDLTVYSDLTCVDPSWCSRVTPELSSLAGLENLRCVSGSVNVFNRTRPVDFSALQNLVEIGGDFLPGGTNAAGTLASLRRVWGDFYSSDASATPRLEAVYGRYVGSSSTDEHRFYIGCGGDDYCRDGVLGCSFTATSTAELEKLSTCEIAIGSLTVSGAALRDLSPLAALRYVDGYLSFYDGGDPAAAESVENLAGLENLVAVTNLTIRGLPRLLTLDALSNLSVRGFRTTQLRTLADTLAGPEGAIFLSTLPALRNLQGLSGTESLRRLEIVDCDGLVDLTGLDALREIGVLQLEGNTALKSLAGLSQLHSAKQVNLLWNGSLADIGALAAIDSMDLTLWDLPSLADLRPLSNVAVGDLQVVLLSKLTTLDGLDSLVDHARIDLQKNAMLEDIGALAQVQHASKIQILSNPRLQSIAGLAGLVSVSADSEIGSNPQLPQCEVDALTARIPAITGSQNDETAACTP